MTLDEVIQEHILETLSESRTRIEAAKKLGICERTLRYYIKKFKRHDLLKPRDNYACMKNLTPNQRDWIENRDNNARLPEDIR